RRTVTTLALATLTACSTDTPDPAPLDPIANRYVVLALQMGHHDPGYVDAWYGPDSLKTIADADTVPLERIGAVADSLLGLLDGPVQAYTDSLVVKLLRYVLTQLWALRSKARMLVGERFTFD